MRLLFVHEKFGAFGGAEANIQITAEELSRRGHELAMAYASITGREIDSWKALFNESWDVSTGQPSIGAVIQDFRPDAIYVHSVSDLGTLSQIARSGVPAVRMVHDHDLYCMRSYKYNVLTRIPCPRAASWRCVFPCGGCVARDRSSRFGVRLKSFLTKRRELALNRSFSQFVVYSQYSKMEMLKNGFDPKRIHIVVPMRVDVTSGPASFSERNLVLFAGQIIRGKGVDYLLRSLAQVHVPFEAVIAGDGSHRAHCERLCAKLGLSNKVQFAGYVARDRLQDLYSHASVFAMSSLWPEPFGMAGPEAMLHGLPVVAFDAGGIREWLQHRENGILVPWGDTSAYASAITEVLLNKSWARKLGNRGTEHVKTSYSAPLQVRRLENIFGDLLEGKARAHARQEMELATL